MPRRLAKSFSYAWRGIIYIFRSQRNIRIHFLTAIGVFGLGYYVQISQTELLFLIFAVFFVLVAEMLNTALEEVVNLGTLTRRARAMVAKDIAAASVLVASLNAVVVGLIIFGPRLVNSFF